MLEKFENRFLCALGFAALPGIAIFLSACSSSPSREVALPLAVTVIPKLETIRQGGPNKPYALAGWTYTPMTDDLPFTERGLASWYGRPFHGRPTAMGEPYNMYGISAAHRTMPLPSYARVKNLDNGKEIIVRINDRGPFVRDRVLDLSFAAARALGIQNLTLVEVERITYASMRDSP
jgi:rare lipoprotein A